ncbi:hypothetical protein FRC14_007098 [Serendipita sp. 396]|nr:hypothetical protein FRC14_007098 [Serendipita sp. 396]KAG8778796.1 hypothetical protein FRC15_010548 [Serendipita sp. 397]
MPSIRMPFTDMQKALSKLDTQLKRMLATLYDPKPALSSTFSSRVATGFTKNPMILTHKYEKSIIELSQELGDVAEQYTALIALFTRRVHEPPASNRRSLVSKLPNEIVTEILKYLVEDGSHHIGPVLFVDKRFYTLVVSTPLLWCNIHIQINEMFEESNKLSVQYINSCLKYSQTTSLNIALDMHHIPVDVSIYQQNRGEGSQQDSDEDSNFHISPQRKVENLVEAITGIAGIHMCRWKSFTYLAPDRELQISEALWNLFRYPTPALETFELGGYASDDTDEFGVAFPALGGVRQLVLPGGDIFMKSSFSYHLLTTLTIEEFMDGTLLDILAGCTQLRELILPFINSACPSRDISFPSLRILSLGGYIDSLSNITLHTPPLESLTLICPPRESFPTMPARSVLWRLNRLNSTCSTEEFLQRLLAKIGGIEELTVDFCGPENSIPAVHEIVSQRDANTAPSLRIVRIFRGDMQLDIIRVTEK